VPKARTARDVWWGRRPCSRSSRDQAWHLHRRIGLEVLIEEAEGLSNAGGRSPGRATGLEEPSSFGAGDLSRLAARPGRRANFDPVSEYPGGLPGTFARVQVLAARPEVPASTPSTPPPIPRLPGPRTAYPPCRQCGPALLGLRRQVGDPPPDQIAISQPENLPPPTAAEIRRGPRPGHRDVPEPRRPVASGGHSARTAGSSTRRPHMRLGGKTSSRRAARASDERRPGDGTIDGRPRPAAFVQWAHGATSAHGRWRDVIQHPHLTLGRGSTSTAREQGSGVDAGELCGVGPPPGNPSPTDDIEEILGLGGGTCVLYNAPGVVTSTKGLPACLAFGPRHRDHARGVPTTRRPMDPGPSASSGSKRACREGRAPRSTARGAARGSSPRRVPIVLTVDPASAFDQLPDRRSSPTSPKTRLAHACSSKLMGFRRRPPRVIRPSAIGSQRRPRSFGPSLRVAGRGPSLAAASTRSRRTGEVATAGGNTSRIAGGDDRGREPSPRSGWFVFPATARGCRSSSSAPLVLWYCNEPNLDSAWDLRPTGLAGWFVDGATAPLDVDPAPSPLPLEADGRACRRGFHRQPGSEHAIRVRVRRRSPGQSARRSTSLQVIASLGE